MKSAAPRITAQHVDGAIVVRIEAAAPVLPPDELVAFPFGLEVSAARKLVRDRVLPSARIGRRVYAKRSDVVGLVDRLARAEAETPAETPTGAYETAVRRARSK